MTSVAMGVCFVMMTFTNDACFYGYGLFGPTIFGCLVGAAMIQNVITHTTLPMVTMLFDLSNGMIMKWKMDVNQVQNSRKKKHIIKILRHTRPIAFACGNVFTKSNGSLFSMHVDSKF